MKKLGLFLVYLMLWSLVIWVHLFFVDVLPFPYNRLNVTIIFGLVSIIMIGNSKILWWFLPPLMIEELFIAMPYGINIIAIFSAFVFFNWCLQSVFVSRSLLIVWLVALATILGYRVLLYFMLFSFGSFSLETLMMSWGNISLEIMWELILTGMMLVIIYIPLMMFVKKLQPGYMMVRHKEYGSKKYFY